MNSIALDSRFLKPTLMVDNPLDGPSFSSITLHMEMVTHIPWHGKSPLGMDMMPQIMVNFIIIWPNLA